MEKKPEKGKMPAMAKVARIMLMAVMGMSFLRPPMLRMSCSWWQAAMTAPDPRKRLALKKAWVKTWNMPALKAPAPMPMNMNPSWDTVE